ncbi:hypothetical protein V2J09_011474 [Rumex salicifolius]
MNTGAATASVPAAASTTARFILDKPLHELTEDDISQLTREDCRRYLKEKGMRRPSWNKSQAIQQVISLKSLLEPPHPTSTNTAPAAPPVRATAPPPPRVTFVSPPQIPTPHVTSNSSSSVKELSPVGREAPESSPADDGASYPQDVSSGSDPLREEDSSHLATDHRADSVRDANRPDFLVRQMTIFYCGKINVYDGVPPDKAETIMQVAASSVQVLHNEPIVRNSLQNGNMGHISCSGVRFNAIPSRTTLSVPVQIDVEGQTNRQVSLQRYREKREERGRFKIRKKIGSSTSGLDFYLNQQIRMQAGSKQLSPGSMSPPIQPGQSRVHYSSMENQLKKSGCGVDLNDKDPGVVGDLFSWWQQEMFLEMVR